MPVKQQWPLNLLNQKVGEGVICANRNSGGALLTQTLATCLALTVLLRIGLVRVIVSLSHFLVSVKRVFFFSWYIVIVHIYELQCDNVSQIFEGRSLASSHSRLSVTTCQSKR